MFQRKKKDGVDGEVSKKYEIGPVLGKGQFAVVRLCTKKETGEEFALKIVDKSGMGKDELDGLKTEIEILKTLDHENIIKVYEVFEKSHKTFIVTELVKGGELFDRIKVKDSYSEKDAATLVRKIAVAIKYYHAKRIVHRDLKPENLLLVSKDDDTSVKIADFGFANYVPDEGLGDGCGTLVYVAPEILEGKLYKTEVDMWSLGVITYILLCGYPPIFSSDERKMVRLVRRGKYRFDPQYWNDISEDAKDFVAGLLTLDTKRRMTAQEVLDHPWIQNLAELPTKELKGATERLAQFQKEQKLRKAFGALKIVALLQSIQDSDDKEEEEAGDA